MVFSKGKQKDINLIPEVETAAKAKKIRLAVIVICVAVVGLLIVASFLISLLSFSENQKSKSLSEKSKSQTAAWQQLSKLAEKISSAKTKQTQLAEVAKTNQAFATSLEKIRSKVPLGVSLANLAVKTTGTFSLQVVAADPAEIYQFVEELKKEKFFSQVSIASLVKNSDKYTLNLNLKVSP
jgi:Tfp pilus assembly protein PilN